MKKGMIALLILILCVVVFFTGCVEEDTTKIEGTVHNNTDETVHYYWQKQPSGSHGSDIIDGNSTEIRELEVGEYKIWASYVSSGEKIDETTMTLQPSDTSFTITIRVDMVLAYAS